MPDLMKNIDVCLLCNSWWINCDDFKGKSPLEIFQIIKTRLEGMAQKYGIVLEMKFRLKTENLP